MSVLLKPGDAHVILNGAGRKLKFYVVNADGSKELRHTWECHDVGVGDANPPNGDEYGHLCKCPPGQGYVLGAPQPCGPNSDDGQAYGYWFIPIYDDAGGDMAKHGRAGIGVHGGGSDLGSPFAPRQGWEHTFGCLRMQNEDLGMQHPADGTLVNAAQYIQRHGGTVVLDVVWP